MCNPLLLFFLFFLSGLILFFPNTMFYTLLLLFFSVSLLYFLVCSSSVTVLIYIIVLIVYGGAIIILIGYICAICPNVSFSSSNISLSLLFFLPFAYFFSNSTFLTPSIPSDLAFFFYSYSGVFMFLVIFISLFVTLLIVTSQHSSPNGPFRSISL